MTWRGQSTCDGKRGVKAVASTAPRLSSPSCRVEDANDDLFNCVHRLHVLMSRYLMLCHRSRSFKPSLYASGRAW